MSTDFQEAEEKHTLKRYLRVSRFYFDLWRDNKNFRKKDQKMLGQLADLKKSLQNGFKQFCDQELGFLRGRCKTTRWLFEHDPELDTNNYS